MMTIKEMKRKLQSNNLNLTDEQIMNLSYSDLRKLIRQTESIERHKGVIQYILDKRGATK